MADSGGTFMFILDKTCNLSRCLHGAAESESNLDSEDSDVRERAPMGTSRSPLKPGAAPSATDGCSGSPSASCSLLDLQVVRTPDRPADSLSSAPKATSGASSSHGPQPPSFTFAALPGNSGRQRPTHHVNTSLLSSLFSTWTHLVSVGRH